MYAHPLSSSLPAPRKTVLGSETRSSSTSLHGLVDIMSFRQVVRLTNSPAVRGLTVGRQALGEFTAVADLRAKPVEDVDGDDDDAGDGGQQRGRVVDGWVRSLAQVVVQGCGVHG